MSLFVELCQTASPTGQEAAVGGMVRARLEELGLEVEEDGAAQATGAGCGNLLCRIGGSGPGWVGFAAHLDTVPHDEPIEVVLDEEGVYRSAGETILGADNKAAIAVLLELANGFVDQPPPIGVELLFTVAEEQGLRGASAFDCSLLGCRTLFVLDLAEDIGRVVTRSPAYHRLSAEVTGVEAHAGLVPEEGRSAILAAARAIVAMELGRLDDSTTANVGLIEGGTSGNVVPGSCRFSGEARSTEPGRAGEVIGQMAEAIVASASETGCEVDIRTERGFDGYEVPEDSVALAVAESALRESGFDPVRTSTGGGSDANVFRSVGLDSILLANGTYLNHTSSENVPRENLVRMLDVCRAIVREAAARC